MKRFTLAFIFIGLAITASAQEIDLKRIDFVNKFYIAVTAHKKCKVIKCMDKEYRKEQIKLLEGDKQQFVDEIFGGFDVESGDFVNMKLDEIENIEIQDAREIRENLWEYVFHVKSKDRTIKVSLELKKTGKKYGFIAAAG